MRYGIAVILIIIVFIVGSVVLVGRALTRSNRSAPPVSRSTKLADYADKEPASVSWTMQGRIVGEDQYKSVRVTVTRRARTVEILDGYKQIPQRQQEFGNTPEAFQTFMRALDHANFGKERVVRVADERGVCPLGNRFIYRLTEGGSEVMRTWSDSCLAADGPSAGNATIIARLFKNQIPEYPKFVTGIKL